MHVHLKFNDVQTAVEALPGLELNYCQLQSGPVDVRVDFQQIDEATVVQTSVDRQVCGRGRVLPGRTLFLLCTRAPQAHLYDGQPLTPGQVYVRRDGEPSQQTIQAGYESILFLLPNELVERHQRIRDAVGLRNGSVLDISTQDSEILVALRAEGLYTDVTQRRNLCDSIVSCLCRSLSLECASDLPSGLDSKRKLASRLRERLEECAEMTLGDIGHDLSISERTLRRVFYQFYGMSPGQYRLNVRLNLVREELWASSPDRGRVSRIATSHGFWHMGRFSSQYRRQFGETATETLNRMDRHHSVGFPTA